MLHLLNQVVQSVPIVESVHPKKLRMSLRRNALYVKQLYHRMVKNLENLHIVVVALQLHSVYLGFSRLF